MPFFRNFNCTKTLQADKKEGVGNGSGWLVRTKEAVKKYIEPTKANTLEVIGATSATTAAVVAAEAATQPKQPTQTTKPATDSTTKVKKPIDTKRVALPPLVKPNILNNSDSTPTTTAKKSTIANTATSAKTPRPYTIDYLNSKPHSGDYFNTTYGGNPVLVSTTPKQALVACYAPKTPNSKTQELQSVASIPARLAGASEELMRDPNNNVNGITNTNSKFK